MAEELLFGKLSSGGHIAITLEKDELKFELESKQELETQESS